MNNKTLLIGISLTLSIMLNGVSAHASEYCGGRVDTFSLRECAMEDYKLEDDRLNKVYQKLRSILGPKDKQQLKAAQLAWIDFKVKDCDFLTGPEYGTVGLLTGISCLTKHTEYRRKALEEHLED